MFIVITVIESHIADTSRCLRRAVREHGFDEEDARLSLDLVERDHEHVGQLQPLAAQRVHLVRPALRPLRRQNIAQRGVCVCTPRHTCVMYMYRTISSMNVFDLSVKR